jgi:hypothetical protein
MAPQIRSHFVGADRGIFIFGGGNKRLRNVTKLYCQCQISHKRRKKECPGKFKFSLNRLKKINSKETNFCQCFKRKSYSHIIKRITNYVSSSTINNFLIANLLHFCRNHERL